MGTAPAGPELLSNLSTLKAWLNIQNTQSDTLLSGLLQRTSAKIFGYLERSSLVVRTYTDIVDGQGNKNQFLENWPVLDISQVLIGNNIIPYAGVPSTTQSTPVLGYRYEQYGGIPPGSPSQVELIGHLFWRGNQNVSITYTAGYGIQSEAWVAAASITALQPFGTWSVDNGVTYASSGASLTYTTSASPAQGQYTISTSQTAAAGTYIFNSADVGQNILISYSYIPSTLEQACLDICNETWTRRSRPGMRSHNLATMESGTFEQYYGIPPWAVTDLQPYKSVLPL